MEMSRAARRMQFDRVERVDRQDRAAGVPANSVRRALDCIGDRWVLLILRKAFTGARRFQSLQVELGVSRSTLASRLRHLCAVGILERVPYQNHPPRCEYALTEMGRELQPAALMVWRWERRWLPRNALPVATLRHAACGRRFEPRLVCVACGGAVNARGSDHCPGPGAGFDPPPTPRRWRCARPATGSSPQGAAELLGDHWLCEVIAAAFFGVRRFEGFLRKVAVAPNILADRLKRAVTAGFFERVPYRESPLRFEYQLVRKGYDLFPWIVTLGEWGDRWLAGPEGPPLLLCHRSCGATLVTRVACSVCNEDMGSHDVHFERNQVCDALAAEAV